MPECPYGSQPLPGRGSPSDYVWVGPASLGALLPDELGFVKFLINSYLGPTLDLGALLGAEAGGIVLVSYPVPVARLCSGQPPEVPTIDIQRLLVDLLAQGGTLDAQMGLVGQIVDYGVRYALRKQWMSVCQCAPAPAGTVPDVTLPVEVNPFTPGGFTAQDFGGNCNFITGGAGGAEHPLDGTFNPGNWGAALWNDPLTQPNVGQKITVVITNKTPPLPYVWHSANFTRTFGFTLVPDLNPDRLWVAENGAHVSVLAVPAGQTRTFTRVVTAADLGSGQGSFRLNMGVPGSADILVPGPDFISCIESHYYVGYTPPVVPPPAPSLPSPPGIICASQEDVCVLLNGILQAVQSGVTDIKRHVGKVESWDLATDPKLAALQAAIDGMNAANLDQLRLLKGLLHMEMIAYPYVGWMRPDQAINVPARGITGLVLSTSTDLTTTGRGRVDTGRTYWFDLGWVTPNWFDAATPMNAQGQRSLYGGSVSSQRWVYETQVFFFDAELSQVVPHWEGDLDVELIWLGMQQTAQLPAP
jgi:hypothetical protein